MSENAKMPVEGKTAKTTGLVGSVVQALAILRFISRHRESARVTTIARELGLNNSTCFNILRTLVAEGFVERDDETKTYSLGVAPLDLARSVLEESGAFPYLRPGMQKIADTFSVTTTLWRRTRSERWVLVGLTESLALARIHLTIGQRLPLYGGAMGRCLAAHSDQTKAELLAHFREVRWHQPPQPEELLKQVALAAQRGWALDDNQFNQFFSSIAAPVVDGDDRVRYCVTQTMFAGQHSAIETEELGRATLRLADTASRHVFGRQRSAANEAAAA